MTKPVYLKDQETRIAGLERKARFLERRSQIPEGASAGGIQFDTHPQDGGWLYAETTDETGSPNGWGVELNSQDEQGIWIHADNWNVLISAGNRVAIGSGEKIVLTGDDAVEMASHHFSVLCTTGLELNMNTVLAGLELTIGTTGGVFTIKNQTTGKIFEVRSDGSIHGRAAAAAITWDL